MSALFSYALEERIRRSAEISDCGRYRWWLRRSWNGGNGKVVCFVGLNPSTADALVDDPTIRRCIGFAKSWGFSTLDMRNLFPFRATDPKELKKAANPRGFDRGDLELRVAAAGGLVIAAWGAGVPFNRDRFVCDDIFRGVSLWCLGTTKNGSPRHPLYVKSDQEPVPFLRCEGKDWRNSA